eukprot:1194761-Prorocentrum_minimum.AAC.3
MAERNRRVASCTSYEQGHLELRATSAEEKVTEARHEVRQLRAALEAREKESNVLKVKLQQLQEWKAQEEEARQSAERTLQKLEYHVSANMAAKGANNGARRSLQGGPTSPYGSNKTSGGGGDALMLMSTDSVEVAEAAAARARDLEVRWCDVYVTLQLRSLTVV